MDQAGNFEFTLQIRIYLQILLPNPTRSVTAKIGNLNSSILIFNEYS